MELEGLQQGHESYWRGKLPQETLEYPGVELKAIDGTFFAAVYGSVLLGPSIIQVVQCVLLAAVLSLAGTRRRRPDWSGLKR